MTCTLWFATSPGHWVKAKSAHLCTSPGHWAKAKTVSYKRTSTAWQTCAPTIPKPTISIMQNVHIASFGKITFTPVVVGATSYIWELQIPGKSWTVLPNGHGPSVTINFNNGNFQHNLVRLKATNASGTTISNTPEITYGSGHATTVVPVTTTGVVITGPSSVTVNAGGTAVFHASVTGAAYWYWYNKLPGGTWAKLSSSAATHTETSVGSNKNGEQFRVIAFDSKGSRHEGPIATMTVRGSTGTVTPPHHTVGSKPTVGHLADVHIHDGDHYTFTGSARGQTSISWFFRKGSSGAWLPWAGHTGTRETGGPAPLSYNGWYWKMRATNSTGYADTNAAKLFVAAKTGSGTTTHPPVTHPHVTHVAVASTSHRTITSTAPTQDNPSGGAYVLVTVTFNGAITAHNNGKIVISIGGSEHSLSSATEHVRVSGNNLIFSIANPRVFANVVSVKFPAGAISIGGHAYVQNAWSKVN